MKLLKSVENKDYFEYLDYLMEHINNKGSDVNVIFIFNEKKIEKLKIKVLNFRKSEKVSKYRLNNLAKEFEKSIIDKVSKKDYLRRIRLEKIKKINEYKE